MDRVNHHRRHHLAAGLGLAVVLAIAAAGSTEGLAWHAGAGAIGFAAGMAGGLVAGAIGLIAIPLLVVLLGMPLHTAAATNLAQTAATASYGAWRHWHLRLLDLRRAGSVLTGGVLGAPIGSWLALRLPARPLAAVFAAAMLVGAVAMAWRAYRPRSQPLPTTPHPAAAPVLGAGLGFASGLLGVGAGFLVTPSLAAVLGLPMHVAVGTGLAVIAGNSVLASVPHVALGEVQWLAASWMALGGAAGVRLGTRLGRHANERLLRGGMAVALAAAAWTLLP